MHNVWTQFAGMLGGFGWWFEVVIECCLALIVWAIYHRLYKYFSMHVKKIKKSWPYALVQSINIPLLCLLWFLFLSNLAKRIVMHVDSTGFKYWHMLYQTAIVIALFSMAMRFVTLMQQAALRKVSRTADAKSSKTSVTAMAQLGRVVIIVITILMLLQIANIPISALLAVGSIGTLTVGFAAKDTLENYMGGAMIFFDRPFGVGDWINLPEQKIEGTVDYIGWRLTKIIGFDKRPYYIPNKIFSNTVIENPSRMTNRRIKKVIGVRYADMTKVDAIVSDIQKMLETHEDIDHETTTFVNLTDFADSSLSILVYAFTKTTLWIPFQQIQQDVLLKIAAIIAEHGAECAFPTRTLDIPDTVKIQKN